MERKIIIAIVTLGFFLQALIPVGFMPSFADDGIIIEICSGDTATYVLVDGDKDSNEHIAADICPYAAIGGCALHGYKNPNFLSLAYAPSYDGSVQSGYSNTHLDDYQTRGPPNNTA